MKSREQAAVAVDLIRAANNFLLRLMMMVKILEKR